MNMLHPQAHTYIYIYTCVHTNESIQLNILYRTLIQHVQSSALGVKPLKRATYASCRPKHIYTYTDTSCRGTYIRGRILPHVADIHMRYKKTKKARKQYAYSPTQGIDPRPLRRSMAGRSWCTDVESTVAGRLPEHAHSPTYTSTHAQSPQLGDSSCVDMQRFCTHAPA